MVRDLLKIVLKKLDSLKLLQENGFVANGHILRLDVSKVFSEDQNTKRKTTGQEREIKLEIISAVVCVYNNILGEKLHERLPGIMFKFTVTYNLFYLCLENVNGFITGTTISWFKEIRGYIPVYLLFFILSSISF